MDISADRYCISCPYVPTILIHHAFFTIKTFLATRTFTLPFTTKIWNLYLKGYTAGTNQQQQQPAQGTAVAGATTAATGYNTTGYAQQAGYNQQYAQTQAQGYNWGQYGYGQGWTQVSRDTVLSAPCVGWSVVTTL